MLFWVFIGNIVLVLTFLCYDLVKYSGLFFSKLECFVNVLKNEKKLQLFLLPHRRFRKVVFAFLFVLVIPVITILLSLVLIRSEILGRVMGHHKFFQKRIVTDEETGKTRTINELFRLKNEFSLYEGRKIIVEVDKPRRYVHGPPLVYEPKSDYAVSIGGKKVAVYSEYDQSRREIPHCLEKDGDKYQVTAYVRKYADFDDFYFDCNMTIGISLLIFTIIFSNIVIIILLYITIKGVYRFNVQNYLKWNYVQKLMGIFSIELRMYELDDYLRCALKVSKRLQSELDDPIFEKESFNGIFRVSRNWISYKSASSHDFCFIGPGSMLLFYTNHHDYTNPRYKGAEYIRMIIDQTTGTRISWIVEPLDLHDTENQFLYDISCVSRSFRNVLQRKRQGLTEPNRPRTSEFFWSSFVAMIQGSVRDSFRRQHNDDRRREIERMVREIRQGGNRENPYLKDDCVICAEEEKIQVALGCCASKICVDCVAKIERNSCPFCRSEIQFDRMKIIKEAKKKE